jgi:UDP:flavonoid glycosyltransferase YjiC (YdhE family)
LSARTTAKQVVEHGPGIQCTLEELTSINLQEGIETLRKDQEIKKSCKLPAKIIKEYGTTRAIEVILKQINQGV